MLFPIPSENWSINQAQNQVFNTFTDRCSVEEKKKDLRKFGRNDIIDTNGATIMEFQGTETAEVYPTTNAIDRVVTDDADYTGTIIIEGHTISGGLLTFVTQTATLTGQTSVTLTTPLARANRILYNSDDELATGKKIYVFENVATTNGVPNTAANTHVILSQSAGRSLKCATSISDNDYYFITEIYGSVLKKTTAIVDFALKARTVGRPFETRIQIGLNTNGQSSFFYNLQAPLIINRNSDIIMTATASTTAVSAIGGFAGYLAAIRSE